MKPSRKILIVDDDINFLVGMRMQLRSIFETLTARSIADGLKLLEEQDVDLVLLDVGLGEENGLDGIKKIHNVHPAVGVAMLSGRKDIKTVVEAVQCGAFDYLTKPVSTEDLIAVVEKAVAIRTMQDRCEAMLRQQTNGKHGRTNIIYKSKNMQLLMDDADRICNHGANVLIVGETGTGKELLAKYIHERTGNGRRPFIAVNCAAIPEHLLESELFGHEAGAFTSANRRRIGKFELADKGDIFLDEIGVMKTDLQVKLLRVLQEKEFCRLGSNTPIKVDFRVISASNQPLQKMVESGEFRIDLYHRLRVVQLELPPLRERTEDIPLLVDHFLGKFSSGKIKGITPGALAMLMEYHWSGNVRELSNVIQSLVIMTKGNVIDETAFPSWVMNNPRHMLGKGSGTEIALPTVFESVTSLQEYIKQAERSYIERVINMHGGDKTKTASALGIGRTTLYMKLKELGITDDSFFPGGRRVG